MSLTDADEIRDLASKASKIDKQNREYYREHAERLQEEYASQIIAIIDQQVVASAEFTGNLGDIQAFIDDLEEEHGAEAAEEAFVTHVTDPDQVLIL